MEIAFERKNLTEGTLTVVVAAEDYKSQVENKIREYAKKATVKGFRAGKVPTAVIRQRYGENIVVEAMDKLIASSIKAYIKENQVPIIGSPIVHMESMKAINWSNLPSTFQLSYQLHLFNITPYTLSKDWVVTRYEMEGDLQPESIEQAWKKLLISFGEEELMSVSKAAHKIYGKIEHPVDNLKKEINFFIHELEEEILQKKLIGLKVGSKITIEPALLIDELQKKGGY